jgi:uroporphyrinogen-III synthase
VAALDCYGWLVFTSPTGVRFFDLAGGAARAREPTAAHVRVAAVGPGTARALAEAGLRADLVAAGSGSARLAADLRQQGLAGQRVLLVAPETRGDLLRKTLVARGAMVDAVAFYRTVAAPDVSETASRVGRERFDVIVFTSPSTLRALLEAAGPDFEALIDGLRGARRVALGRVTAKAMAEHGLAADAIARRPDDEALVDAVMELFGEEAGPLC